MEDYQLLEQELAEWAGYEPEQVVACSSGTAALHLALEALQLPSRSKVIVPDYTMIACPRAVILAGLTPVFADCNDRLLMSENAFRMVRNSDAEAAMFVHVYGRKVDDWFFDNADDYHLAVIEDMAEAHGIKPSPYSDAACWSFYKNKIVAGEEGGAVAFHDPELADLARSLRSLGFTGAHDYTHIPRGHNYRMSNMHAHAIRFSLSRVDENVRWRRELEAVCIELCPAEWKMPPRQAPWVYDLRIPGLTEAKQRQAIWELRNIDVPVRFGFKPMSTQEEYRNHDVVGEDNARQASSEVIYFPLTPGLNSKSALRRGFEKLKTIVG